MATNGEKAAVVSTEASNKPHTHRKNYSEWTDSQTNGIIAVWGEHVDDLRRVKRNRHVYDAIRVSLAQAHGILKTVEEVKTKIANLTKLYRKERQRQKSGASPSKWKFYDSINVLLGSFPSQDDELLHESISLTTQNVALVSEGVDGDGNSVFGVKLSEPSTSYSSSPNPSSDTTSLQFSEDSSSQSTPTTTVPPGVLKRCPKKRSRQMIMDEMVQGLGTMNEGNKLLRQGIAETDAETLRILRQQTELQERSLSQNAQMLELLKRFMEK